MTRLSLLLCLSFATTVSGATITDLTEWSPIEDPADPGMSFGTLAADSATLVATGAVPSGTDIGYVSVDGADVATSSSGFYFDPSSDFSVAIDFNVAAASSVGGGGIGFGIGEGADGANSAGVALAIANGVNVLFGTAGRVNDANLPIESIAAGFGVGRMYVDYDAASGDVTVGVNATPGAAGPSATQVISAIQTQWGGDPLVVSFFLRSQAVTPIPALSGGSLTAVFSNFEVLSGTAIAIVPEPSSTLLAILGALGVLGGSPRQARG